GLLGPADIRWPFGSIDPQVGHLELGTRVAQLHLHALQGPAEVEGAREAILALGRHALLQYGDERPRDVGAIHRSDGAALDAPDEIEGAVAATAHLEGRLPGEHR